MDPPVAAPGGAAAPAPQALTELLERIQSTDHAVRTAAEAQLTALQEANVSSFLLQLCAELAGEDRPIQARQLAGIIIKNSVDAKDRVRYQEVTRRWLEAIDEAVKAQIRSMLLTTLGSRTRAAGHTAAQVIAKIAAIEMPAGRWADLVKALLQNVTEPNSPELLQTATLETLGYMCEEAYTGDLDADILSSQSDHILTAVVSGMRFAGQGPEATELRRSATTALLNALEFVRQNFERTNERNYIMETTCAATTNADPIVRKTAYECLVKVAENYYDKLSQYISTLFDITVKAIRSDEEPVALQAIEFWSSIAEEETVLLDEARTAAEMGQQPERASQEYAKQALQHLCPVIFDCLMQQDEDHEEDTWNKSTAAGACLVLLAEVAPDTIVQHILPFVRGNINDQNNWRAREAATMAFGSILEGPPINALAPLIDEAVPTLQSMMASDPSSQVRDTAAWTLGRVCSISPATVQRHSATLAEVFIGSLQDSPPVARNACWAIHNFAECFTQESENPTGTLSQYVPRLLQSLFVATAREDASESNLRASAYEALNVVLQNVPQDTVNAVSQCVPLLLERLETTFASQPVSEEDREEISELQGLLCSSLQTATQRLMREGIRPYADRMMQDYLRVLAQAGQGPQASVHEEALMAVGAMADAVEREFVTYMEAFMPYLEVGLQNWQQYQVCGVAVGVVGDICRAIEREIMTYAPRIVALLMSALTSEELDKSIKPAIFSCFGDLAMAIGGEFEQFLAPVMTYLQQAAQSSVQLEIAADDFDMLDWMFLLRESIFEAYTGIIQGLKGDHKEALLVSHTPWMLQFCEMVSADNSAVDSGNVQAGEKLLGAATGVLGDIVSSLDGLRPHVRQLVWVQSLVQRSSESDDQGVRETADWARQAIFA